MTTLKAATLGVISDPQHEAVVVRLPKRLFAVLTVLAGMSGTAAIVVPFTLGVSPLDALHFELYRFLVPAFLTPPAIAAVVGRWLRAGSLNRIERLVAVTLGTATALSTFVFLVRAILQTWPETSQEWASLLSSCVVLLAAVWFFAMGTVDRDFRAVVVMQAAYAASGTFCLVGFAGDWQIGAWLSLATLLIYAIQLGYADAAGHASSSSPTRRIN
jgi:hypothetical protein